MALSHTLFNGGVANVSSFSVTHTPRTILTGRVSIYALDVGGWCGPFLVTGFAFNKKKEEKICDSAKLDIGL